MSSPKWLTEIVSSSTKIFITHPRYLIAQEIDKLLKNNPSVELVGETDKYDVLLDLVGFDQTNWSETLHYTVGLHRYLDAALINRAKFLLVAPDTASAFGQVARSVVEQFSKNFSLSYVIAETGSLTPPETAARQIVELLTGQQLHPQSQLPVETARIKTPTQWKAWLTIIMILLSPWLVLGGLVSFILGTVYCTHITIGKGKWDWAIKCSAAAGQAAYLMGPLMPLAPHSGVGELRETVIYLAAALQQVDEVMRQLQPYEVALTDSNAPPPPADTSGLSSQLSQLSERLGYLQQSQLQISSQVWEKLIPFSSQVDAVRGLVSKLNLVIPQLGQLLSLSGQAQWLVLVQDNTELRPTGGYVDSVGLVKIQRGHLVEARFMSSQAADAQLKGQIVPPLELQKLLGETNWYLRDSNWDPDFPTSAARAAWFVGKELDQPVDAVLAINLSTLIQMTQVLGPINLPEWGGQITAQNWLDNYLHTIKLDSPDRFSSQLAEMLFTASRNLPLAKLVNLIQLVMTGLETRQIQIWPTTFTASALMAVGWDGRLDLPGCSSPYPCVNDFLYQADANVGLNKVDPWINRQGQMEVEVDSQYTTVTYQLTYTHTGADAGWPLGEYTDYVRLYLSPAAQIQEISLINTPVAADKIDKSTERGLIKLSLLVSVAPGKTEQLRIKWRQASPAGPRWHYQLQIPNQSGVAPYPFQVQINYPPGWWSQAGPVPQVVSPGRIGYNSLMSRPQRFNIDWVPSQP